mgnify:CR=1 FL=1
MRLPIQAPPVMRTWASGRLGGVARAAGGLLLSGLTPQSVVVDCPAVGDCAAWICKDGETCGVCQDSGNGWAGTCTK